MKMLSRLLLCGLFGVPPLFAQFGTDNFTTSANWSVVSTGNGTSAFNSRLDYLVSTPTTSDSITATWQSSSPIPYASDWTAVVDLHLLSMSLAMPAKSAYFNLVVSDKDHPSFSMNVYQFRMIDGSGAKEGFQSEFHGGVDSGSGGGPYNVPYIPYLSSSANDSKLMLTFNSTTKMLTSFVSISPTYTWTPLQSFDIGSGQYAWDVTGGFKIQLNVLSQSMMGTLAFASGDAYFSNFAVTPTAIPEPAAYAAGFGALALLVAGLRRRFGQQ